MAPVSVCTSISRVYTSMPSPSERYIASESAIQAAIAVSSSVFEAKCPGLKDGGGVADGGAVGARVGRGVGCGVVVGAAVVGIDVGESRALGGLANLTLLAAPNVSLNLRGAGQVAFSSLPSSMGFSLGSDVGLIGLPGSIASGDSGWLAVGELIWTVWEKDKQQLQLLPYIGKGGVHTELAGVSFEDQVGSCLLYTSPSPRDRG